MNNSELQVLKRNYYLKTSNKKIRNEMELFFANFEEKLKARLTDEIEILLSEMQKTEIIKNKYEIIESICNYRSIKMLTFMYQNDSNIFKVLEEKDLSYYASIYLDSIFNNVLKSFDKAQENLDKYEKEEVYDALYDYFLKAFKSHKGKEKDVYTTLNSINEREGCFKDIETCLDFAEFNKIYTRALNELKTIYQAEINRKKTTINWRKEGIGWALALAHLRFAKSLKKPRK